MTLVRELLEFKRPDRVDVERDAKGHLVRAVLRGVKVLGNRSGNRNPDGTHNTYPLEARRASLHLYEGARVFVNHPVDRSKPRQCEDLFGWIEGARAQADGTFGDLHVLPSHPLADRAVWLAEHRPDLLGLSHVAKGRGRIDGTDCVMEAIEAVDSVDLVSRAATTKSLFEGANPDSLDVLRVGGGALPEPVRAMLFDIATTMDALSTRAGRPATATQFVAEALQVAPAARPSPAKSIDPARYGTKSKNNPSPSAPMSARKGAANAERPSPVQSLGDLRRYRNGRIA